VVLAQLVRASVCGTEGRGFEPHIPPQVLKAVLRRTAFFLPYFFVNYLLLIENLLRYQLEAYQKVGSVERNEISIIDLNIKNDITVCAVNTLNMKDPNSNKELAISRWIKW
jgi:hypothetical protein